MKPSNVALELPFNSELFTCQIPDSVLLEPTSHVKNLRILVPKNLSWSHHIASIVAKARGVASWACSVFKSRDRDTMMTLYQSLIRSHLEYCSPVWHPSKIEDIELIEGVQKEFTAKINGLEHL